jgi:hypothetical protein
MNEKRLPERRRKTGSCPGRQKYHVKLVAADVKISEAGLSATEYEA